MSETNKQIKYGFCIYLTNGTEKTFSGNRYLIERDKDGYLITDGNNIVTQYFFPFANILYLQRYEESEDIV